MTKPTIISATLTFLALFFLNKKTEKTPNTIIENEKKDDPNDPNHPLYSVIKEPGKIYTRFLKADFEFDKKIRNQHNYNISFQIINNSGQDFLKKENSELQMTKIKCLNKWGDTVFEMPMYDNFDIVTNGAKYISIPFSQKWYINKKIPAVSTDKLKFYIEYVYRGQTYTTTKSI